MVTDAHPNFRLKDPALLVSGGWIDGKAVPASNGKTYPVTDPGRGTPWFNQQDLPAKDVDAAIASAEKAFIKWSKTPARERGRILLEADRLMKEATNDVAQIMVLESGKTLAEAKGEIGLCTGYSSVMAGEAERLGGETIKGADTSNAGMRYFTIRDPLGPVALLCPWNFPIVLPWRKSAAALAAGCTIVLKPAPETTLTSLAMASIFTRAGLPPGVLNVIPTSYEATPAIGKMLCEDARIKMIHFTGSTAVGKLIASQSASTLKHLALELGGNGAFIIFEDADLEKAATALVGNKFRNAGQVCVSANRVYCHKSVLDKFVGLFQAKIEALKVGHGLEDGVTLGPLTTERGRDRCEKFVSDAVSKGAKVVLGGKRHGSGYHFEPTLIVGAGPDAMVHTTEMFSPIASVYGFNTEEEVINIANDTPFGLTNYVFTENFSRGWRCFEALQSGQVAINSGNATAPEAPFGGIKESGYGKEGGFKYSAEEFCNVRTCALAL